MVEFIKICLKWKKQIAIICAFAAVASITISLLMPEYYESRVIFYPSNPSLSDRQYLFGEQSGELLVSYFGAGDDLDRVMTIAKSATIVNYLIDTFNLMEHYGIKMDDKYPLTKVRNEFEDNYKVIKNEYDAVELTVLDTSSELASKIANESARKVDESIKEIIKQNKARIIEVFQDNLATKEQQLKKLTDSINALVPGSIRPETISLLFQKQETVAEELNTLSSLHEKYVASYNANFPTIYIFERAYPAEKKKYPVRWLIVVGSVIATLFLSVIFVLLLEKYREIKPQLA
ncbi:MAG: hypothetical protein IH946_07980 [Bacteroidetes bacterium]|nr:hypothetical protein [Bacteroidota bacterium]